MGFSTVNASKTIVDKYIRYLKTIFSIKDTKYSKQFEKALRDVDSFAKGPFLDVTDSFVKGKSIEELIELGILAKGFSKIKMPSTRPLYKHQENSISRVINEKNIVVSTGTGSGKTESFLIPIFNYLIRQNEENKLGSGVRALIIYPMNALANDQMERLRELLKDYPDITYGSYTGQTRQKYNDAMIEFKRLNDQKEPPQNELISREQMKKNPPNILITNYAMLEYLMVRPDDNVFFDGEYSDNWKYIVLDEAHVYNGSTGIEVSMLLRRLKAKFKNNDIRYILTSATLGGENDNLEVAEFAQNLCDSKFDEKDVIRAERIHIKPEHECKELPIEFYNDVSTLIDKEETEKKIIESICKKNNIAAKKELGELLYEIVLHDENYWKIRNYLKTTKTIVETAKFMNWNENEVQNFVTVASKCERNGDRLFDARYHMFLRATDSIFITLSPSNKLFLTRKLYHYEGNEEYKVFEIATCSYCNAIYIVGKQSGDGYLEQSNIIDEESNYSTFLLGNSVSDTDEDHLLEDEKINYEEYNLCSKCGHLSRPGAQKEHCCEHDSQYYVRVFKVKINNPSHRLTKCLSCENSNSLGVLRMFFTGQEAVTSVIGTALYEELPAYSIKQEVIQDDDDMGFGIQNIIINESKTNIAKQFIAFSDNRQAAAFYSSYLDQTYRNILYKRLIIETLKNNAYKTRGKTFNYFIDDLICTFEKYNIATKNIDLTSKEAWKAALQEIVDNNGNTSLETMGFIGISLNPENIPPNNRLNLSSDYVATICSVFALGMMADAAVIYNANLNVADKEFFTHNGIEYGYTETDSDPKNYKRSFSPTKSNMTNKRLDYLTKVLKKAGNDISDEKARDILGKGFWKIFNALGFVKAIDDKYKLDLEKVMITKPTQWYICPKCKKVTMHNAFNVCPSFKCDGELQPIDIEEYFKDNHYYKMYQELDIRELRVVEHTAQLNKETAYEYQRQFKQKEIDVLSCSTTFEMGVDVGSLETVFMRNMPPSPSNYAQRAGRAGRSKHSSAYAITFCNKSSHDFTFFKNPEKMIRGKIDPPKFKVENEKIAIRHVYASALAYFWKKNPEYFSDVATMNENLDETKSGYELFIEFLNAHPANLKSYLKNFLPASLSEKFGVENYNWIDSMTSKEEGKEGVFTKAILEYEYEVNILNEAIDRAIKSGDRIDNLRERIRVYRKEGILSFLSRKNVLPKYGFPVDTVEMTIIDRTNKSRLGLQLQRDLSVAISEYAPDSQIIANGNLITSRYIKKIPNMNWKQYDYILCNDCKTLNIKPHTEDEDLSKLENCMQCGKSFEGISKKVFLIPQFGFEADGEKIKKPGLKKPERTFKGETAYVGYKNDIELQNYKIGNASFQIGMSQADEMAVLNESNFYVCEDCGYTVLKNKEFTKFIFQRHKKPSGYWCKNDGTNKLKRFSLGYRFETDVIQIRFLNPDLTEWEVALSVLYGVLRGVCSYLNIEESDISGCPQYFFNDITHRPNYELVLYDKTPGGAGHVRRINSAAVLEGILKESLKLMEQCNCGGEKKDSSCYTCLRGYYNQKYHDELKRKYVIDFLNGILS